MTFGSDNEEAKRALRELILFIADRCEDEPTFGATKLNKILFYADFLSYALYGEPIAGVTYRKLERGPVPTILKLGSAFFDFLAYSPRALCEVTRWMGGRASRCSTS